MKFKEMDKKNKIILISGIAMVFVTLLATIVSAFFTPKAPDPKELGPRTKVSYMASKEFSRLPEAEKKKYISRVGRPRKIFKDLNDNERAAVFKNVRKVMLGKMKERINKFSRMSQEEKNKFLDEMIARRNAMRAQNGGKDRTGGPGGGNRSARMQGMLENVDSTTRAQMSEMHKLIQERSKQTQGK
jgi:polyhydroxyalkanoate synthesis regulator phasin